MLGSICRQTLLCSLSSCQILQSRNLPIQTLLSCLLRPLQHKLPKQKVIHRPIHINKLASREEPGRDLVTQGGVFLIKKDRFLILKICIIHSDKQGVMTLVEVWHIQIYEKITLFLSSVNTFSKIMVPVASFISFINTKSPIHCVIYTPMRAKKEIL